MKFTLDWISISPTPLSPVTSETPAVVIHVNNDPEDFKPPTKLLNQRNIQLYAVQF